MPKINKKYDKNHLAVTSNKISLSVFRKTLTFYIKQELENTASLKKILEACLLGAFSHHHYKIAKYLLQVANDHKIYLETGHDEFYCIAHGDHLKNFLLLFNYRQENKKLYLATNDLKDFSSDLLNSLTTLAYNESVKIIKHIIKYNIYLKIDKRFTNEFVQGILLLHSCNAGKLKLLNFLAKNGTDLSLLAKDICAEEAWNWRCNYVAKMEKKKMKSIFKNHKNSKNFIL